MHRFYATLKIDGTSIFIASMERGKLENVMWVRDAFMGNSDFFQGFSLICVIIHTMKTISHVSTVACRFFSVCFLCLALCDPSPAAMIEGAKEKTWPANSENHQITIRREVADAAQTKMIATAEAARPEAAALRKAIGEGPESKDASQWWYREVLGIRIPFAVTAEAVGYFSKLVGDYRKQEFKRFLEPGSSVDYHASVASHLQFEHDGRKFSDVHVVTLKLVFAQNFAASGTEGMRFEKVRTVVLDAAGKVVAVYGDGPTEVPVLAI